MSIRQADGIADTIANLGVAWNRPWDGRAVAVSLPHPSSTELPGGLRLTILSPRPAELRRLAKQWLNSRRVRGVDPTGLSIEPEPEPAAISSGRRRGVLVFYAYADARWAKDIERMVAAQPGGEAVEFRSTEGFASASVPSVEALSESVERATAGVLLVSPALLGSSWLIDQALPVLTKAAKGELRISWVLLKAAAWELTPLAQLQALHDPGRPLSTIPARKRGSAIRKIALSIIALVTPLGSRASRREAPRGAPDLDAPDLDAMANATFIPDPSVANNASIAFLAEHEHAAILVGGDARAEVLTESIAALLEQTGRKRLRLDAFVVPHGGSKHNVSRQLLQVLDCDRYLFSSDGSTFLHPHRETIARILVYGRVDESRRLTLVFNYRSETTEIWADRSLQERYRYTAIYPDAGAAGLTVQI